MLCTGPAAGVVPCYLALVFKVKCLLHKILLQTLSTVGLKCCKKGALMLQVPLALIEGRVTHVVWPPSRLSRVPPFNPPGRLLMKNNFALKER